MSCDPCKLIAESERELLRRCSQPRWTSPMLATLTDERFSDEDWIFERKLDGERALVFRSGGNTRLMTRNRKTIKEACEKGWEGVIAKDVRVCPQPLPLLAQVQMHSQPGTRHRRLHGAEIQPRGVWRPARRLLR